MAKHAFAHVATKCLTSGFIAAKTAAGLAACYGSYRFFERAAEAFVHFSKEPTLGHGVSFLAFAVAVPALLFGAGKLIDLTTHHFEKKYPHAISKLYKTFNSYADSIFSGAKIFGLMGTTAMFSFASVTDAGGIFTRAAQSLNTEAWIQNTISTIGRFGGAVVACSIFGHPFSKEFKKLTKNDSASKPGPKPGQP